MGTGAHPREYRFSGSWFWFWFAMATPLVGAGGLLYDMGADGLPIGVLVAVVLGFAAFFSWILLLLRTATICDERQITILGTFGTRSLAWSDVQGIEIEDQAGGPQKQIAVLYDADGRRRVLPFLNDRGTGDLAGEVAALREMWIRGRGEDWAPGP